MAQNNIRARKGQPEGKEGPGMLRKAGDRLKKVGQYAQQFDDMYSARIADMYRDSSDSMATAAAMVGGSSPSLRKFDPGVNKDAGGMEKAMGAMMTYGVPLANAVPKYALPAAGVTLAGKGLIDIGTALATPGMDEQQTGGTIMPS